MSTRTKRAVVLLSAGCVLMSTAVVASVAQAGPYPINAPTCSVSQGTVAPGNSVTVSGKHWLPNSTVEISLKDDGTLGSATTNGAGSFSTVVTIPSSAPTGSTQIVCSGQKRNGVAIVLGTTITIAEVGGAGVTAFTGAQLQVWMFLAIVLFGLGLGLILISRRRRTDPLR